MNCAFSMAIHPVDKKCSFPHLCTPFKLAGNTPLHYACCGGYEDVVVTLLDAGASIEETNENGHTPLMEAASAGHVGVAKILLDRGAGINTHSNEFKESALTLACYKGHLEMVKFLLEAGADQEHKTGGSSDGRKCVYWRNETATRWAE